MTSSLKAFAPDPYFVPGYGGYVPQQAFRYSKSYGRTTHDILNDKGVRRSKTSVLDNLQAPSTEPRDSGKISGYTGHVPVSRQYFGRSFVPKVNLSTSVFIQRRHNEEDLRKRQFEAPLHRLERSQSTILPQLEPKTTSSVSVPDLGVISGYTGFVPRIQHRFAKSYLNRVDEARNLPRKIVLSDVKLNGHNFRIYKEDGLIPKYTGFVPGKRFEHARTYGNTTRSLAA
ncbi:Oidioi.mRNA.OKI2018_I69.chr1.g2892.t1.cds [Oikopleura dioica]|uniref:Ciliary microtubule inner protein 2B n=1 Tax=Oikopleura dioica TaxID=34765 RepID=A0ABN7SZC3_OIKDI|nr:Oidioi.mRNA.OKI2018_I69.chr1.g2892.t1.cds [Oikopleura dioica]